jgi:7,8-dihydropterin-6-yl-methyl-4-(beta-D-ribofuranosyl)aminobenzene 5'-phosphate synthase
MSETLPLNPVDAVEVTILADNTFDALAADESIARHPKRRRDSLEREQLRAEHRYSLLVTVENGGRSQSILHDAGVGRDTLLHNVDVLDLRPGELRAIVLSHGHADSPADCISRVGCSRRSSRGRWLSSRGWRQH